MRLYISIATVDRNQLRGGNTSNAVYLRGGILFDSKIKQLRGKASRAYRHRRPKAVPVTAGWRAAAKSAERGAEPYGDGRSLPRPTSL
jgi:hypothetical protein